MLLKTTRSHTRKELKRSKMKGNEGKHRNDNGQRMCITLSAMLNRTLDSR